MQTTITNVFSPLVIGEIVATYKERVVIVTTEEIFSPLVIGEIVATRRVCFHQPFWPQALSYRPVPFKTADFRKYLFCAKTSSLSKSRHNLVVSGSISMNEYAGRARIPAKS